MTGMISSDRTNTPVLGGTHRVPPGITSETLRHLQAFRRTEAVCFWLGKSEDGSVLELWVPKFAATAVSYDIEPVEMLRLKNYLDATGLILVAQVHSHPGMAFHSGTDDQHAASPWPGYISIVVPNGGRIVGDFWNAVEAYERVEGGGWRQIKGAEKRSRFSKEVK